jgi:hypothetical protein
MRTMELGTRFPKEYEAWEKRRIEIEKRFQTTITQRQEESTKLFRKSPETYSQSTRSCDRRNFESLSVSIDSPLASIIKCTNIHLCLNFFRMLRRDGFPPELNLCTSRTQSTPGEAAGKPDNLLHQARFSHGA